MQTLDVARAEREHEDAVAEEQRLRAAIRSGDVTVTGSDLAAAEAEVRLAALRVEAARDIAAEEAEAARREQLAALLGTAPGELHGDLTTILARFDLAVNALGKVLAAVDSYNTRARATAHALSELGPLPAGVTATESALRLGDVEVDRVPAERIVAEAAYRAALATGVEPPPGVIAAAGLHVDAHSSAVYGVEARADGAHALVGLTDRLRWITDQLAPNTEEN